MACSQAIPKFGPRAEEYRFAIGYQSGGIKESFSRVYQVPELR